MVITGLEADDTSPWQTRHQAEEDPVSGGLDLERPSKDEVANVLGFSTTASSILSPTNLVKIHADDAQNYM